jgi:hypothetical protein
MTGIQPELCFMYNQLFHFFTGKLQVSAVQPDKVGALGLDKVDAGQIRSDVLADILQIFIQIGF